MIKDFKSIKNIVNEFDPIHLLDSTADNEYDSEVREIISLLSDNDNVNTVADKIYKVFIESFDEQLAGDKDVYIAIAQKILV